MADFISRLNTGALLCDGATGSYLFELTGRLSENHHVYEALNADQPELIERVHLDYLAAGARCLKTNTFGANHRSLHVYGLNHRLAHLNRAAVAVARAAIDKFTAQHGHADDLFLLASIGPTADPLATRDTVDACYREQIETLIGAGVDALLLETFASVTQLEHVIRLIRSIPGAPPVVAEMTIHSTSAGNIWEPSPSSFIDRMRDLAVPVAGVNCCAPWDAITFVEAVKDHDAVRHGQVKLCVMPNAGGFQRIGNRFMTSVNPEFAGKLARRFFDQGVRLIGGCCEMHPPHIREMRNFIHSRETSRATTGIAVQSSLPPADDAMKQRNGPFSRKIKTGAFAVSIEMLPPRGTDPAVTDKKIDAILKFAKSGLVDAVDFTDGSRGIPLMPPGDFIQVIRQRSGWTAETGDPLELIPHFAARDLNVIGIQSRLIGYHANRIHNVLFITGDPPKMSPTYPRSTGIFDLDSVAMIRMTHKCLNAGIDFGGAPLGKTDDPRTHFTIGTGFEPESLAPARELDRLRQKIDAGADYVMTQPAFRHEPLAALDPYRAKCRFLVGVMLLTGLDHARRMAEVPGVVVPVTILEHLGRYTAPSDQSKAGIDLAREQVAWAQREGWDGVYLMSSASPLASIEVLQAVNNAGKSQPSAKSRTVLP
jgi:homocysteine S-methyltransferase